FTLSASFFKDVKAQEPDKLMSDLRKPILVMHSPQDNIVGIENAREIYEHAWHPKSFVSLDGADHLLSTKNDAQYAGKMLAAWAKRYIETPEEKPIKNHGIATAVNRFPEIGTPVAVGEKHYIYSDEPEDIGGKDYGPTPHGLLSAGLASCTAMTLNLYAKRKDWEYRELRVEVDYEKKKTEDGEQETFHRKITIDSDLSQEQLDRLVEIAQKCPVHKSLERQAKITTELED
ncbi:MAG: OsmC family protein, partial [Luteibaculum sp.]